MAEQMDRELVQQLHLLLLRQAEEKIPRVEALLVDRRIQEILPQVEIWLQEKTFVEWTVLTRLPKRKNNLHRILEHLSLCHDLYLSLCQKPLKHIYRSKTLLLKCSLYSYMLDVKYLKQTILFRRYSCQISKMFVFWRFLNCFCASILYYCIVKCVSPKLFLFERNI